MVKVKRYDYGPPEEFLKCRLTLNEQVKNNGYEDNHDNVMNLAQAMLAGRSLEALLNEKRSQEAKNRIRKANTIIEHTPKQIYNFAILELAIHAFDIQSGWRDAYERQREYMRRDILMGKLNPERFSQRLQDLNRYLDFIPIEKQVTTTKLPRHMESHCQKMKSYPSWDEQSHLNGQSICWHLEKNLGDSRTWKIS
jgi:hypothetical protein